jgi:hypothetical protein
MSAQEKGAETGGRAFPRSGQRVVGQAMQGGGEMMQSSVSTGEIMIAVAVLAILVAALSRPTVVVVDYQDTRPDVPGILAALVVLTPVLLVLAWTMLE